MIVAIILMIMYVVLFNFTMFSENKMARNISITLTFIIFGFSLSFLMALKGFLMLSGAQLVATIVIGSIGYSSIMFEKD